MFLLCYNVWGDIMKNVLVTGSSRGIGKQTIIEFAKLGYNVVINYVNSDKEALQLKEYVEREYNIKALTIKCDVSNETDVSNMIKEVLKTFNKIDVLVNNAAIAIDNDYILKDSKEFKRVLDVNLVGSYLVTKYVSKYMLEQKRGKIIFVSSTNGIDTNYEYSMDYDASKAGVISLMKNFAQILSPYITVNTVAPGWVNTEMNSSLELEYKKLEEERILLKRFADSKEIAKVITFLVCEDASYINNSVIRVDGGLK